MTLLKKYFKNVWTLEWKNEVSTLKRLQIMFMLLSPFLLVILYTIYLLNLNPQVIINILLKDVDVSLLQHVIYLKLLLAHSNT